MKRTILVPGGIHLASGKDADFFSGKLVETSPTLKFTIDYPLTTPFLFEQTHEDGSGWTGAQVLAAIQTSYARIYASEVDPGMTTGLLNRSTSKGPYGIWGHYYDDLYLEDMHRKPDGSWELIVGS